MKFQLTKKDMQKKNDGEKLHKLGQNVYQIEITIEEFKTIYGIMYAACFFSLSS